MEVKDETMLEQVNKLVKKKRINVKQKGKRGESWVADELSDVSGLHFHRIFSSGASVGQSNSDKLDILTQNQGESQLGDVQSPEDLKYYFIWECKNYGELDFHNLIKPTGNFSKQIIDWLAELEYDLESALIRMKNNTRFTIGFLCVKITRKGSWIVGNYDYVSNFKDIKLNNTVLFFYNPPKESLRRFGFGDKYFLTDFKTFIKDNKNVLFIIDKERKERLEKAKEAFNKIYNGEN